MLYTLSELVSLFLGLTKKEKKLISEIYKSHAKYGNYFQKGNKLCENARCHSDTRKRLKRKNSKLHDSLFTVKARYAVNGRQTSDEYILTKEFLEALIWLNKNYGFSPKRSKYEQILKHATKDLEPQKCAPLLYENAPPLVKISLKKERFKSTPLDPLKKEYIHPKIAQVKIPFEDQIMLSRYPEACIEWGLENTLYSYHKGCKINDPTAFLWANIRLAEKRIKNGRRFENP